MDAIGNVVNGNGTLDREYAIRTRRMDLCLRYGGLESVTLGIQLKVWRDGEEDPLAEGLAQLDAYLDGLGLPSGWLVIFDRRSGQPPIAKRTTDEPDATLRLSAGQADGVKVVLLVATASARRSWPRNFVSE